jgi:outer membrane protein OmpA-like peptidoglycan-associated protein
MKNRTHSRLRWSLAQGLLLVAALCVGTGVQAQKLKERMAQRSAEVFDYPKVVAIYENIQAKGKAGPEDLRKLAHAYRKVERYADAEATYVKLMATGEQTPEDIRAYADLLRTNGKYNEALEWYNNLVQVKPDDAYAKAYTKDPAIFTKLMRDSASATIRTVPINSSKADLGMSVLEELLLFSSARGEGAGGSRTYSWDEQPYLNLYSALLKGETAEEPMVMRNDVNSRYHDGTLSYDSLAKRMYFTRNHAHYGVLDKSKKGYLNLGIYFSDVVVGEFGQQEWGDLVSFDYNDPEFNNGHPCVSHDGRSLFFVSDRPGGYGGTDIWVCRNLGNSWGAPENLGPEVNTPGNEMYPFIRRDSTLFFASDGHPGLGGLDLFSVRLRPSGPGRVRNLGYPMNTRWNDHSLILINDSTGFLASDRIGGLGSDDIYGFTMRPPTAYLAGIVIDKETREPIEGAVIVLKDVHGDRIKRQKISTEPGGRFNIETEEHARYLLTVNRPGYYQVEKPVDVDVDDIGNIVVEMTKYDYMADGIVTHGESGDPLEGATVKLLDPNGNVVATTTTDANGHYEFPLEAEKDYRVEVERDGFFKQSAKITTRGQTSANIRTDFKLFPLQVDQVIRLDNIYYDLNKWNIRPDAALELDKLVATLQDNPNVKIELSSHTDCRGKDAYNLTLSQKRAKSAVDYLISKGIGKDRVTSKGYGETKPVATCVCEQCTEDEHQQNRRTEFKVLSIE